MHSFVLFRFFPGWLWSPRPWWQLLLAASGCAWPCGWAFGKSWCRHPCALWVDRPYRSFKKTWNIHWPCVQFGSQLLVWTEVFQSSGRGWVDVQNNLQLKLPSQNHLTFCLYCFGSLFLFYTCPRGTRDHAGCFSGGCETEWAKGQTSWGHFWIMYISNDILQCNSTSLASIL